MLISITLIQVVLANTETSYIVVYGLEHCHSCKVFLSILRKLKSDTTLNITLTLKNINDNSNLREYMKILTILGLGERPLPLMVFIHGNNVCVAYGVFNETYLLDILEGKRTNALIIGRNDKVVEKPITSKLCKEIISIINKYNIRKSYKSPSLLIITSLALSDSINPCTIYLYVLLLLISSTMGLGKAINSRKTLEIGLAFCLAVMLGYVLIGLSIINLLLLMLIPRQIFSAIAVIFGMYMILLHDKEKIIGKSRFVNLFRSLWRSARSQERLTYPIRFHFSKANTILFSICLGFLASFTILPCSAGPYIVFLGIVSGLPIHIAFPLVLYYNLLFISPLLIILILFAMGLSITKIRNFIVTKGKLLSTISGVLLISIGIYLLF